MTDQLTSNPPFNPAAVNQYIDEAESIARQADADGKLTSPFHLSPWPVREDRNAGVIRQLHQVAYLGSARAARDFYFESQRIANDRTLSAHGQAEKRVAAAEGHLKLLATFSDDLIPRAKRTLTGKLATIEASPEKTDVKTEIRFREIRDCYAALDDGARLREVGRALDEDDRETLSALLTAPAIRRCLLPEMRSRVEATLLERTFPAELGELNDLRAAIAVASETVDDAVRWIRSQADRPDFEAATHRMQLQAFRPHARG